MSDEKQAYRHSSLISISAATRIAMTAGVVILMWVAIFWAAYLP